MPPQVLAAYRDPLDLAKLLASSVFTDKERFAVRDELLERLIAKHGSVEVEIGKGSKLIPIRKRVAQFKKSAWGSIDVMLNTDQFGDREDLLLELAKSMQPYWSRWWDAQEWGTSSIAYKSIQTAGLALGKRQLTWLAAQYARSAMVAMRSGYRQNAEEIISATENWAIVPSDEHRETVSVLDEDYALYPEDSAVMVMNMNPALMASACLLFEHSSDLLDRTATASVYLAQDYGVTYSALCELTKRLITPTLVTSASRGLR